MVLNKKGNMFGLWFSIVVFNIFIVVAFTFLIGFNNIALDEIITPIHTTTSAVASNTTSLAIQTHIDDSYQAYQDNTIPWDLVMFGLMINFYFGLIYSAIRSKKESSFTVFSMLTFGSIFLLLLISVSVDVQTWFLNELYIDVFEDLSVNTPIMDWLFQNMGMVSFIMAMLVLLVNQFDRLKTLMIGRFEE